MFIGIDFKIGYFSNNFLPFSFDNSATIEPSIIGSSVVSVSHHFSPVSDSRRKKTFVVFPFSAVKVFVSAMKPSFLISIVYVPGSMRCVPFSYFFPFIVAVAEDGA